MCSRVGSRVVECVARMCGMLPGARPALTLWIEPACTGVCVRYAASRGTAASARGGAKDLRFTIYDASHFCDCVDSCFARASSVRYASEAELATSGNRQVAPF